MQIRLSVRWILVAGCFVIVGALALGAIALFGEDTDETDVHIEALPPRATQNRLRRPSAYPEVREVRSEPEPRDPEELRVDHDWTDYEADPDPALVDGIDHVGPIGGKPYLDEISRFKRTQQLIEAELVPEYDGGDFAGLRVRGTPPSEESMLRTMGIERGDLITSVNGLRVGDEGVDSVVLFRELSRHGDVEATVVDSSGSESGRSNF